MSRLLENTVGLHGIPTDEELLRVFHELVKNVPPAPPSCKGCSSEQGEYHHLCRFEECPLHHGIKLSECECVPQKLGFNWEEILRLQEARDKLGCFFREHKHLRVRVDLRVL